MSLAPQMSFESNSFWMALNKAMMCHWDAYDLSKRLLRESMLFKEITVQKPFSGADFLCAIMMKLA